MPVRFEFDDERLVQLLRDQDDVVDRGQLLMLGASASDVERFVRQRLLTRVHEGIYVAHTGPLTQRQREWVAVRAAWPAVLAGPSALPGGSAGKVYVAVAHGRTLQLPEWVCMRRVVDLDERARWLRSPPRLRVEEALLDVMEEHVVKDAMAEAFAALARVVTSRETTPDRILARLQRRRRIRGRRIIEAMLIDARDGVCSVLERGYLRRVERPHGIPRGSRQHPSRATGGRTWQDVRYASFRLIVELDGTLGHTSAAARDADALRDLYELADSDELTVRATYGVVFRHGCRAARLIGSILRREGWNGELRRCPQCPP